TASGAARGSGSEAHEVVEVAAVERQLDHLGVVDGGGDDALGGFQQLGFGVYIDGLRDLAHAEAEGQVKGAGDIEFEVFLGLLLEAWGRYFDTVRSRNQGKYRKGSALVARHIPGHAGTGIDDTNFGIRHT